MHSVMDCIQISSFSALCKIGLASRSAVLSLNSHLQILLCAVGNNLTKKLSELGGMLCFLISCLLPVQADLRIALSVSDSGHCQVHTNLFALALVVCSQVSNDIFAYALSYTDNVLCCP